MAVEISVAQLRRMRWSAQLLGGSELAPAEVVRRAVALQGQDLASVLRAIAMRSRPGTTIAEVRAAFDAGEIVRAWPMRGTLFVTTPQHLATLQHFTAARIHRAAALQRARLDLDDATVARARELLSDELATRPLTRAEALGLLNAAGISTAAGRGYQLLMHLCVDGLAHWGRFDAAGGEQLLTLSATPAPADPEAALASILRDYLLARGPASEADFAWWTKLPKATVRHAASAIDDLVELRVDGAAAWTIGEPPAADAVPDPELVTLLPGFDEWILGYVDRSFTAGPAMIPALAPAGNGIFLPTVLVDAVAVGTWRLTRPPRAAASSRARGAVTPALVPVFEPVERIPRATRRAIDTALAAWPHS